MTDHATVHYRLYQMPCCTFRLMWIDQEMVHFCPACGVEMPRGVPLETLVDDPAALLTYDDAYEEV